MKSMDISLYHLCHIMFPLMRRKKIKKGLLFYETQLDIFTRDALSMIINGIIR